MAGGERHRRWGGLLLCIAATVATLCGLEGAARALDLDHHYLPPRVDVMNAAPGSPTPHPESASPIRPFAVVRSQYASDPRGYFDPGGVIRHVHNERGYRDVSHTREKPPGVTRIVALGDSYLWGQGVRREDLALTRVGHRLGEALPQRSFEMLNLGVSGANSEDQWAILQADGLPFEPDLVLLFMVLNDIVPRAGAGFDLEFNPDFQAIVGRRDWLGQWSQLWAWLRQRYRYHEIARRHIAATVEGFDGRSLDWRMSREMIGEMGAACKEAGVPFLVVLFPYFYHLNGAYPFADVHRIITRDLKAQGHDVLDLRTYFPGFDGPELWVHPTDQHPNEIAQGIAGDAVADHLLARPDLLGE